jgi:hypothetical protein
MKNTDRVLILSLFGGYTLKLLALGAQPADAAVVLVLAAAHWAYNAQLERKEINELRQEIKDIKANQQDQNTIISELKTAVTGIKMSSFRSVK